MKILMLVTLTLVAAVLLVACGDDDEAIPADSEGSPAAELDMSDFSATVDNPYFPLDPGHAYVYEGEDTDEDTGETLEIRVESTVLDETHEVGGVEVRVVEVREYEDGEIVESTRDYFAQDADGTVYYMGEDVDDYEDGAIVGHHGAWLQGQDGAIAGVFMPADPQQGDTFEQEHAPGVAEDESTIIETGVLVTVPAGEFDDCIKTDDYDPLGDARENKYYCSGTGLVREEAENTLLELISF